MVDIILLSLIQGITEFLPISSSSHLIIFSQYLEFNNKNLEIDVSLHIGSFFAVVVFFRKDILKLKKNSNDTYWINKDNTNSSMRNQF